MKTERYENDQKEFRCFGFPNTFIGKEGTKNILSQLPGIEIKFLYKSWGAEIFCEFTYKGEKFDVCEPYGDNSYYDISCETPNSPQLEEIYELFVSTSLPTVQQRKKYNNAGLLIALGLTGILIYVVAISS